jgi:penicillin-binding protein 2
MSEPSIIFNEVNERQGMFGRRVFLLGGLTGAGLGVLTGRLAQLQLIQNEAYRNKAIENRYNEVLVVPPRGLIVDRNDIALASSRPNFRVMITRDRTKDVDATLAALGQILTISEAQVERIKETMQVTPASSPVSVAEDLTWEEFAAINARAPELPGVTAAMGEARVYPFGGAFAHVVGYVQKPNREDLETNGNERNRFTLHPGFRIGKAGVEKALDKELRGRPGFQMNEVDSRGRVISRNPADDVPPVPGEKVVLSLDADVQNRALEVFGEESGAAVVMDCRTGDLLCMASAPSYDTNRYVTGFSTAEYNALKNYERNPLLDKAMYGTYPPGSTFKTMTALAALEAGIDPEERVTCPGSWRYGRNTWRCHNVHGSQNMHEAIKNSCDVYFYETSVKMGPRDVGPNKIAEISKAMGLGQIFDIGIPGQRAGIVPNPAWKAEYFATRNPAETTWYPGETPSVAIGQGALAVNALQLCVMTARLANGRKALNPRLISSVGGRELPRGSDVPDLPFAAEHIDYVRAGMAAVTAAGGTGYRNSQLDLGDVLMAGKTGTAQVRSYTAGTTRNNAALEWLRRDHGLFVAFAPYDDPRYAISVIVEHGAGGSTAAAPRAREIMRVALMKDPDIRERLRMQSQVITAGVPETGV